ncbi:PQQ-binding-like beta-propeller repeat protein [Actinomadura rudentiformis]|uniref:PQQ-binding-like beta-propeller repeat protein n=1 Tax=Actinomadura rudentiformis TaxID=359158 RepID=A0A6H9YLY5_9ACTN|nr:PQQ-binding-like beta-propeller repeat protein [Actinomadura rudentiformis]KAB2340576.1 PQQ-binding-like beta-propeller repeat protein [Actinomadura rudentiformis]
MEVTPHYGDDGRTGVYWVSGVPDKAEVAWVARTDTPVVASPVLAGDTLLAADVSGMLYAFDAVTGGLRWRRVVGEGYRDGRADFMVAPDVWNSWVFVELWRGQFGLRRSYRRVGPHAR